MDVEMLVSCACSSTILLIIDCVLGLVKGLNEVCKALDRKQVLICVLASDCEDPKYKKLVTVSRQKPLKV